MDESLRGDRGYDPGARGGAKAVSDQAVGELVAELERTGFGVLPGYIGYEALSELQQFAYRAVQDKGGEYAVFTGKAAVAGTLLAELPADPAFRSLVRRIYERATGRPAPQQSIYQVLRCLAGKSGLEQSYIFHYDSYVVTLLLPITIPTRGRSGHLVIAPNLRTVHESYLRNLLDKAIVDNPLTQFALRTFHRAGLLKLKRIELNPGDLYVILGYRTLHANEPCDIENIRSTALFHFGDPHCESALRRRLGRVAVTALDEDGGCPLSAD